MTFIMYAVCFNLEYIVDFIENCMFKKLWLCLEFLPVIMLLVEQ